MDRLCDSLFLSRTAREADDNLAFVRNRLLRGEADLASLLDLYRKIQQGKRVKDDETNPLVTLLRLSGVVRVEDGVLRVRNRIYAHVFDREWVLAHMPGAELRRQRAAYIRGVVRTAAVSAAMLAVVGGLALTAVKQAQRADRSAREQARLRRQAEEGQQALRRVVYADRVSQAQQTEEGGNLAHAQELLETLRPEPGQEDLRGWEWRYLWRLCQGDARATLRGHAGGVTSVAASPDGKTLASGGADHSVRLWDAPSGQLVATLTGHKDQVITVAFSPDGKIVASSSRDGTVRLWDVASRREIAILKGHTGPVEPLAFSPDGRLLASGSPSPRDRTVRLWDVATRRALAVIPGQAPAIHALAFSPDGKTLAIGSAGGPIQLYEVSASGRRCRPIASLAGHTRPVLALAFSPDGRRLVSGSVDATVRLWDVATRREAARPSGHGSWVASVAFSPDGTLLASAGGDKTLKLWDARTAQEVSTFKGHRDGVTSVAFSPDGKTLVSGSLDETVKLWDAATTALLRQSAPATAVAFSPDGRQLASGTGDGAVTLWDVAAARKRMTLRGHRSQVDLLAFSPDGKLLASGSQDHTLKLWEIAARGPAPDPTVVPPSPRVGGRVLVTLKGFKGASSTTGVAAAFSPNGRTLAWQGEEGVNLWDLASHRVVARLPWEKGSYALGLAFSPDGRTLAAARRPGTISFWDVTTRRAAGTLSGYPPFMFVPGGSMFVLSTDLGDVRLWDTAADRPLATFRRREGGFGPITLSPDGKTLAAAGSNVVTLWNLAARQEVAALRGSTGQVAAAAFSPDGSLLATAASDGTVRLWHAARLQEADPLRVTASGSDRAVSLQWLAVPHAVAYHIDRGPAGARGVQNTGLATASGGADSFTDRSPGLVNGRTQTYGVAPAFRSTDGKLVEGPPVTVHATPADVPAGWAASDINEGPPYGQVRWDRATGQVNLRGAGWDIWNEADSCYLLSHPEVGDFQITVRLPVPPTTFGRSACKAGLMVRESLDPGARQVSLLIAPAEGVCVQYRSFRSSSANEWREVLAKKDTTFPLTLRLTRRGQRVIPEYSRDGGRRFEPAGGPYQCDDPLPRTLYAGLVVMSHNRTRTTEAKFTGLEIAGPGGERSN